MVPLNRNGCRCITDLHPYCSGIDGGFVPVPLVLDVGASLGQVVLSGLDGYCLG